MSNVWALSNNIADNLCTFDTEAEVWEDKASICAALAVVFKTLKLMFVKLDFEVFALR